MLIIDDGNILELQPFQTCRERTGGGFVLLPSCSEILWGGEGTPLSKASRWLFLGSLTSCLFMDEVELMSRDQVCWPQNILQNTKLQCMYTFESMAIHAHNLLD